jgi:hypothetical protein
VILQRSLIQSLLALYLDVLMIATTMAHVQVKDVAVMLVGLVMDVKLNHALIIANLMGCVTMELVHAAQGL